MIVAGGVLECPSANRYEDGQNLFRQCLEKIDQEIDGRTRFPPKLFILWATPAFADYQELLREIQEAKNSALFEKTPLIGTTAGAVLFDGDVYEQGAVLICLASEWLTIQPAVAHHADTHPDDAVEALFDTLKMNTGPDLNSRGNSLLLTYIHGYSADLDPEKYVGPKILEVISRKTFGRLPTYGGLSCASTTATGSVPTVGYQFVTAQ